MGKRLAIAALALAGALLVLLWLGRREQGEIRVARIDSQLLVFDDRRVAAFTLEEGGKTFRFERSGTEWRITAPRSDPASAGAIDAVFGALRGAVVVRTLPGDTALEPFGLDPARHALRFEGADLPGIDIGDVDPTGTGIFVRVVSKPEVRLVRLPEAQPLAGLSVDRLRDRRLLAVPRSRVSGISIARDGKEVRLVRREAGWWIAAPREFPAADGAVDRLLEILAASEAGAIDEGADPSAASLGLAGADVTTLGLTAGEEARRLVLGKVLPDGSAWGTRDDRVAPMRFAEPKFDRLPLTFDALRETRLTKLNRYAVQKVSWRAPEGELVAAREGETTWKDASGTLLRGAAVVEFLAAALDAPVAGWSDGAASGTPQAVLEVEADGNVRERVEFFANRTARVASVPGVVFRLGADRPVYRP